MRAEGLLGRALLVDEEHAEEIGNRVAGILDGIENTNGSARRSAKFNGRLARARKRLARLCAAPAFLYDALDGRTLRYLSKKELLEEVARGINREHA